MGAHNSHGLDTPFGTDGNCLSLGGIPLPLLAARCGSTPFYAYDRRAVSERVRQLRQELPAGLEIHYAIKANPMPALVCHMANLVDGMDVASGGELQCALDAGMSARNISFAGPGKGREELCSAVAAGALINLESLREVHLLAEISSQLAQPARVALRVNPDFELKLSGMKMGGGPKQFGVDAEQAPAVLAEIGRLGLAFEGFHIFSGSQNLKPEAIVEAQSLSVALASRLAQAAPAPVTTLNIGGGFGIPYFPNDRPLDLAPIAANLSACQERAGQDMPGAKLILELGRYLVGEAGIYVCRVLDRKVSRGQVFLVTDGGMHHHLAASGNFGQVIRKNYPVAIGNRLLGEEQENVSVVGPLCTPLDILADRVLLPKAEPGDLFVVFQSGAYGRSASPLGFLGHKPPQEVLV